MAEGQPPTVGDLFRRAQALWRENPDVSLKEMQKQLVREFKGGRFPSLERLAIPEQDARAPEEDWSAGLSLVARGIQLESWDEIAQGIALSLEQTERYERERGLSGAQDEWHDRSVGIRASEEKGIGKWMPEELMRLAERSTKKQ